MEKDLDELKKEILEKDKIEGAPKGQTCEGCSLCCRYVALEIDTPEDSEDIDQIRWYVLHKNVWVFIDHDDSWNLQFNTPCEKLDENLCSIYEKRPQICRSYSTENCERYGEGDSFKVLFRNLEDFEKWLKEDENHKKFDYDLQKLEKR